MIFQKIRIFATDFIWKIALKKAVRKNSKISKRRWKMRWKYFLISSKPTILFEKTTSLDLFWKLNLFKKVFKKQSFWKSHFFENLQLAVLQSTNYNNTLKTTQLNTQYNTLTPAFIWSYSVHLERSRESTSGKVPFRLLLLLSIYLKFTNYIYIVRNIYMTKAMAEMKREHWTKRRNWSSCTKLALTVSWTHGLIAQSVRASERNSVVVDSNPTQANFL